MRTIETTMVVVFALLGSFCICQAEFVHHFNPLVGGSASIFGRDGNLWIGVPGVGLVSLDVDSGLTSIYGLKHGLRKVDYIHQVAQDASGRMWLSQLDLISCFDSGMFTCYGRESGIWRSKPPIGCDPDGSVWTVSIDGGLRRFDGQEWVEVNDAPIGNAVFIKFGPDGTGWFLCWTGPMGVMYLVSYRDGAWTVFDDLEVGGDPSYMAVTRNNDVWVVTYELVFVCRDGTLLREYRLADGLAGYRSSRVAEDAQDHIWVGDYDAGAAMFDGDQWTVFNTLNSGIISNNVKSVAASPDGSVFFTTDLGVSRYNAGLWNNYGRSGLPTNDIYSVAISEQGDVYYGTYSGELGHFDGSVWEVLYDSAPVGACQVYDLAFDRRGAIWLAENDMVEVWLGSVTGHARAGDMPLAQSKRLALDNDGNMWVCAGLGLARYNFTSWLSFRITEGDNPPGYHPLQPRSIACDLEGNVWVGTTEAGLAKLRDDAIVGLLPEYPGVMAIACDNDGVLWMGFDGRGVLEFDGENELAWYTVDDGLPSNEITCIDCDISNNVWVGADEGIAFFNRQQWTTYDLETGLEVDQIRDVYCSPICGDVWFATPAGLLQYESEIQPVKPSITITTDRELYHAGDTMTVALTYKNPGPDVYIDIQVACQLPDGSLFYYPGGDMPEPFMSGMLPSGTTVPMVFVLIWDFPPDFPAGDYTWMTAMFEQGTFNMISDIATAPFTFE